MSRIPFLNQIWLPVSERHEGAFWIKVVCSLMSLKSLHIRHIYAVSKYKENSRPGVTALHQAQATSRGRYAIPIHHISPAELYFNVVLCITDTVRNCSRCRQTPLEHQRHVGHSVPSFTHLPELLSASPCIPITSLMSSKVSSGLVCHCWSLLSPGDRLIPAQGAL